MAADDFFQQFFIRPIFESTGYNIFNTLAYGGLLIVVSYFIYRAIENYKVKIDLEFMAALTPFIIFSAFVRVLTDSGFHPKSFFTVSPGIEIVIGLPALVALLAIRTRFREHTRKFVLFGVFLCITQLPFYRVVSWTALFQIVFVFAAWFALFHVLRSKADFLKSPLLFWALMANMLDGTATFVTMQFYSHFYFEQHIVANIFMDLFGAAGMFVMKLVVILPLFYFMHKHEEDRNLNNFIFLIIFSLGLAAGLRDAMRLVMMV